MSGDQSVRGPVTAIAVGVGVRGNNYAYYSVDCPQKLKMVAVCDPKDFKRKRFATQYKISEDMTFTDWRPCVERPKFADCVFICVQDQLHKEPAIAFAKKGYHILLEKPMAVTESDCCEIVDTCRHHGVMLAVCHVLRYTPQARKIRQLIESGVIGDLVNIQLTEPVGHWHFAHSYVRGNWRNTEGATFSLLAKSCHDIDLLLFWTKATSCTAVSSFGSLKHFTAKNKPAGAGSRCLDCAVEKTCPYSAKRIYLDSGRRGWPVSVIVDVPDIENITDALKTGPYGRCVYECDNNVCDNQVVSLQFSNGSTASFTMIAFTEKICERQVKVYGTMGELSCGFEDMKVSHHNFVTGERVVYDLLRENSGLAHTSLRGHGGADFFAMEAFVKAIWHNDPSHILTGPEESLASHVLCFKAEEARLGNKVVNLTE